MQSLALYSFFDDAVFIENTRPGQDGVLTELITAIPVSFDVMYGKNLLCRRFVLQICSITRITTTPTLNINTHKNRMM